MVHILLVHRQDQGDVVYETASTLAHSGSRSYHCIESLFKGPTGLRLVELLESCGRLLDPVSTTYAFNIT